MKFSALIATVLIVFACRSSYANEPQYSLDSLDQHLRRFVPAYGHASQSPGSPKYFVPGYGYRVPGFGFTTPSLPTPTSYNDHYEFGRRRHALYNDRQYRFWSNSYGGPWYHAGSSVNTQSRWPTN